MAEIIQNLSKMNRMRAAGRATFGDVVYEPSGFCGPRTQQDFQLVVMYDGEAHIEIDSMVQHLPAQHVSLMKPDHAEYFRFTETHRTHHSWCAVHPSLVPSDLGLLLEDAPFCLPLSAHMHGCIELGLTVPPSALPSATALLEQLGLAALHQFVFEAESASTQSALPQAVLLALQVMDAQLAHDLSLSAVARAANVTPQHLIKLFRRHLHTTPTKYLWQARVRRGVELLCATGLSMSEVAERSGFANPFHFSRLVKQHYHKTPKQLREAAWK
jgi:AraC family transcriptional regulator of arabinose operon